MAALVDQVMVSGLNFLTGVILVRGLGLANFGKYAVAYAILLYANSLQLSFVTAPMLSIGPLQEPGRRHMYLEGMYAVQVLSSIFLLTAVAVFGLVATLFTRFFDFPFIVAFACCVGTFQLQDWLRRYYLLQRRGVSAILTDSISYLGQVILLFLLWHANRLSLFTTFVAMAVTSFGGFLMGPFSGELKLRGQHLRMAWQESTAMARDLVVANQARWFGIQGVLIIATNIVGPPSIGGLRATQNMTGPMNLALLSLDNVVPARLSEELYARGVESAYRVAKRATIVILKASTVMVPVIIFGKPILRFIYGPEIVPFYGAMIIQVFNILLSAVGRMQFYFFRSVQEIRPVLVANIASAIISVGIVFPLGKTLGPLGVICSSTIGQLVIVGVLFSYWMRHRTRLLAGNPLRAPFANHSSVSCCETLNDEVSRGEGSALSCE